VCAWREPAPANNNRVLAAPERVERVPAERARDGNVVRALDLLYLIALDIGFYVVHESAVTCCRNFRERATTVNRL
jgi:hypothetical protein